MQIKVSLLFITECKQIFLSGFVVYVCLVELMLVRVVLVWKVHQTSKEANKVGL